MRERILIVEDEPAISEAVEYALRAEGFEVEAVDDGNTALAQARARAYDLLVLDLMLPGLSGVEVCRQLRRRLRHEAVLRARARGAGARTAAPT